MEKDNFIFGRCVFTAEAQNLLLLFMFFTDMLPEIMTRFCWTNHRGKKAGIPADMTNMYFIIYFWNIILAGLRVRPATRLLLKQLHVASTYLHPKWILATLADALLLWFIAPTVSCWHIWTRWWKEPFWMRPSWCTFGATASQFEPRDTRRGWWWHFSGLILATLEMTQ